MMGIAATSTLEGGGARNTSVWDNLTLLISENTDKKLPKSFRLISSRGDGFKLRSFICAYVSLFGGDNRGESESLREREAIALPSINASCENQAA